MIKRLLKKKPVFLLEKSEDEQQKLKNLEKTCLQKYWAR